MSVAVDGGHVCGGLLDGRIEVWSRSTLEQERTLTGHKDSLLFVGGWLVSGSYDRSIRVRDVASGRCEAVLEGHTGYVRSLGSSGSRLLSGSFDGTMKVWGVEAGESTWRCDRTLDEQGSGIWCLAAWGDRVACGCVDGGIRVRSRSSETWGLERTLRGHEGSICALAVSGGRLISSSDDGTVRVWSAGTRGCVQTVGACPAGSDRWIASLAVCGSALVGGTCGGSASEEREVRVLVQKRIQKRIRVLVMDAFLDQDRGPGDAAAAAHAAAGGGGGSVLACVRREGGVEGGGAAGGGVGAAGDDGRRGVKGGWGGSRTGGLRPESRVVVGATWVECHGDEGWGCWSESACQGACACPSYQGACGSIRVVPESSHCHARTHARPGPHAIRIRYPSRP